jgi:hypothetical protein
MILLSMLASELRAAVYVIDKANRQFGLDLEVPVGLVDQPFMIHCKGILHSSITGLPLIIAGSQVVMEEMNDKTKIRITDGRWEFPNTKRGRHVQMMLMHALDGVDLGSDAHRKVECIIGTVNDLVKNRFKDSRWQIAAILEQVARERALRAENTALRAERAGVQQ